MASAYLKEMMILGGAYLLLFIVSYTPFGMLLTGSTMPVFLLYLKLSIAILIGLSLVGSSVYRMRKAGRKHGKSSLGYNLATLIITLFLLLQTSNLAYLVGASY